MTTKQSITKTSTFDGDCSLLKASWRAVQVTYCASQNHLKGCSVGSANRMFGTLVNRSEMALAAFRRIETTFVKKYDLQNPSLTMEVADLINMAATRQNALAD